jgi:enterochelin esterase-like enzyme
MPALHAPQALAIETLLQAKPLTAEAIQRFVQRNTFPIIEGSRATFIFIGEAEEVHLRHWIYALASSPKFTRVEDTDLWYFTMELPYGSRVEYKIEVLRNGRSEWLRDPLNPFLANDPFGANSVCQGQGYTLPTWIEPDPHARPGQLQHFKLANTPLGDTRDVTLYLPARYRSTRRYPLLVVHDGGDYLNYARMKTVLDNLIHSLEVAPMIVAFTYPKHRIDEYPDNPRHAAFITQQLVPFLEARFPLYGQPSMRCLMGASFGGVASLSTAWRAPKFFGKLFLQSGSFAFTDIGDHKRGPAFDPVVRFMNAFRAAPGKPSESVFMTCGTYESLIYENRSMLPLLRDTGMKVRYVEVPDGHNWENWRDRMREGLSWLFPGPLWMVYE